MQVLLEVDEMGGGAAGDFLMNWARAICRQPGNQCLAQTVTT
jgi:hypothetical protein